MEPLQYIVKSPRASTTISPASQFESISCVPTTEMSTFSSYRECMKSFQQLFNSLGLEGPENVPAKLREDVGRFRVWAENCGAHRQSNNRMSLDHRLREASRVKNMVLRLLRDLNAALQDGSFDLLLLQLVGLS